MGKVNKELSNITSKLIKLVVMCGILVSTLVLKDGSPGFNSSVSISHSFVQKLKYNFFFQINMTILSNVLTKRYLYNRY